MKTLQDLRSIKPSQLDSASVAVCKLAKENSLRQAQLAEVFCESAEYADWIARVARTLQVDFARAATILSVGVEIGYQLAQEVAE